MGLLFTTEGTRRIINTLNTAFDGPTPQGVTPPIGLDLIRTYALKTGINYDKDLEALVNNANSQWVPGALALALDLLPFDQGSGDGDKGNGPDPAQNAPNTVNPKAARRWYHFLTKVLGQPTTSGSATTYGPTWTTLQSALKDAIFNTAPDPTDTGKFINIVRVSFDHVEIDENTPADPNNPTNLPGDAPPTIVVYDMPLPHDSSATFKTPPFLRHITLFTVRMPKKHDGAQYKRKALIAAPWNTDPSQ